MRGRGVLVRRRRLSGNEVVIATWCTADAKAGVLTIHMNERCFEAEVYADEGRLFIALQRRELINITIIINSS